MSVAVTRPVVLRLYHKELHRPIPTLRGQIVIKLTIEPDAPRVDVHAPGRPTFLARISRPGGETRARRSTRRKKGYGRLTIVYRSIFCPPA
jgi:hypothetical protein